MNASWLIQLVQTPVVVYAVVLTIAWTLIQLASKIGRRETKVRVNEKLVLAALWIYMVLALAAIVIDVKIFPFLHSAMFALTLCAALCASPKRSAPLLTVTLIVALMPVMVMVSTKHPLPLGDDARFIGFAAIIKSDGRWIPFKYPENPYYQPFHLIPAIEYVLASITGVGIKSLEGIMACYLTLKLALYLAYFILLFLFVRRLVNSAASPLVAVLLLSITPPLALSQVVHQGYAIVLSLATLLIMSRTREISSGADSIAEHFLWISGIIAHATYTIIVSAFALPIIFMCRQERQKIVKATGILFMISLTYWIFTYVIDVIMRPSINAFDRLMDLITGRTSLFYRASRPWYGPEQREFFIAWALVPSIIASYVLLLALAAPLKTILYTLSAKRKSLKNFLCEKHGINAFFEHYIIALSFLGLGGTIINFILRALPTFGGRYFYWLYLLMLPSSVILLTKTTRKILGSILSIILISVTAFYGVQDPTIVADTYGNYIGWADRGSWYISYAISTFLTPSLFARVDARLAAPLAAIRPFGFNSAGFNIKPVLLLIGADRVGLFQIFSEPNVFQLSNINYSSIILEFYIYNGFVDEASSFIP